MSGVLLVDCRLNALCRALQALLEGMLVSRPSRSRKQSMLSGPSSNGNAMDVDNATADEDEAEDVQMQEEDEDEERERKSRELAEGFVASGTYVTLTIPNVPIVVSCSCGLFKSS